jgi:hypothetical protein
LQEFRAILGDFVVRSRCSSQLDHSTSARGLIAELLTLMTAHCRALVKLSSLIITKLSPLLIRTCSQTSELGDSSPDLRARGLITRPPSSGTRRQTSELGDSSLDLRARGLVTRPPSSGTPRQTSELEDLSLDLRARGLLAKPLSSGTFTRPPSSGTRH